MNHLRKRFSPLVSTQIYRYSTTSTECLSDKDFKIVLKDHDDILTLNRLIRMRRADLIRTKKTKGNSYSLVLALRTGNMEIVDRIIADKPKPGRPNEQYFAYQAIYETYNTGTANKLVYTMTYVLGYAVYSTWKIDIGIDLLETYLRTQRYDRIPRMIIRSALAQAITDVASMDEYLPSLPLINKVCGLGIGEIARCIIHQLLLGSYETIQQNIFVRKYKIMNYISDDHLMLSYRSSAEFATSFAGSRRSLLFKEIHKRLVEYEKSHPKKSPSNLLNRFTSFVEKIHHRMTR